MRAKQKTKPVLDGMGFIFFVLVLIALVSACAPPPTPTPEVLPTRTRRATRTPFPTLTPRATRTAIPSPINAVVTDTLRVREQPSTSARILGRLQKDAVVQLLSRSDDNQWFSIEYPSSSGQLGWIFGQVVTPDGDISKLPVGFIAPKPPEGAIFATVSGDGGVLRMRAGPGTNYEILARIPDKSRVLLIAKLADSTWYQTIFPPASGTVGWISGEFLTLEGSNAAMQVAQAPPTPTPGPTPVPRPTRAPNIASGGSILISSNRNGAYDIFSIGENGVERRQLTHTGNALGARYSPDGERIVFYRTVSTSPNNVNHIFVMDFDGNSVTDLSARSGGGFSDSAPDWSPDGKRIVFVRTPRAGAPELWTMNASGGNAKMLLKLSAASGVANEFSPAPHWSPDGGRVAFAAVPRVKTAGAPLYPSIFVVNADGSDERQLTDNDLININPIWSPDGSQIAWSARDFLNRQNWRAWIMNASGADQRIFLAPPGGDANNGIQAIEWRDNRILAAGWTGNWNVFLVDAGGSDLEQVTRTFSNDIPTDWLP
ncbi:MAG: hypothetical protein EYC68_00150 [Chloroflexota bacterium]|nr:MAG: hypothetical protein EYC68_00150 [Chloroflexota bacterium]